MVNIIPCNNADYITLFHSEKGIFKDHMLKNDLINLERQTSHVIWKIEDKQTIGFVSFFHIKDEIEIIKICIIKSHQRKNYGSILIDKIKKLKIKKIFLEVSVENTNAIKFYFKNGFEKIGVRKGYYARNKSSRIDALRLCVKL